MRGSNGAVLIIAGLLLLWLAVTGRYACLVGFFNCLVSGVWEDTLVKTAPKVDGTIPNQTGPASIIPPDPFRPFGTPPLVPQSNPSGRNTAIFSLPEIRVI